MPELIGVHYDKGSGKVRAIVRGTQASRVLEQSSQRGDCLYGIVRKIPKEALEGKTSRMRVIESYPDGTVEVELERRG